MIYKGVKIEGFEVYDSNNDNEVIANICDEFTETDNGYRVRVIPCTEVNTNEKWYNLHNVRFYSKIKP